MMKPYHCRQARTTPDIQTGVGEDPSDIVTLWRDAMFRERSIVLLRNSLRTLKSLFFLVVVVICFLIRDG